MHAANRSIKNEALPKCCDDIGMNNRIMPIGKMMKSSSIASGDSGIDLTIKRLSSPPSPSLDAPSQGKKTTKKTKSSTNNNNSNNNSSRSDDEREKLRSKIVLLNKTIHRNQFQLSNDLKSYEAKEVRAQNMQDKYLKAIRENKKHARDSIMHDYWKTIDKNKNLMQIIKKDIKAEKRELKKLNKMIETLCEKNASNNNGCQNHTITEAAHTQEELWNTVCKNEHLLEQRHLAKEENTELIMSLHKYQEACNKEVHNRKVIQKYLNKIGLYVADKCQNEDELASETKTMIAECKSRAKKTIRAVLKKQKQLQQASEVEETK